MVGVEFKPTVFHKNRDGFLNSGLNMKGSVTQ